MRWAIESRVLLGLFTVSIVTLGCGGGGGVGGGGGGEPSEPPSVEIVDPRNDLTVVPGGMLEIEYKDHGDPAFARTTVAADQDGDPTTTADQVVIASDRVVQGGEPQYLLWDLTGVPLGTYRMLGITDDGVNPVAVDEANGRVTVANTSFVVTAGSTLSDQSYSNAVCPDGSSYVAGHVRDGGVFGEGEPGETTVSADRHKCFVARYEGSGALAWVRTWGGDGLWLQASRGVDALRDGACVVVGSCHGPAVFGPGESGETTFPAAPGEVCCFFARYEADGTLAWVRRTDPHTAAMSAYRVLALPDDGCVCQGTLQSKIVVGAGGPESVVLDRLGGIDVFLARFEVDGTLAWAHSLSSTGSDYTGPMAWLPGGTILVSGKHQFPMTLGEGEPNETTLTEYSAFLAAYALDGTLQWARSLGTHGDNIRPEGMAVFGDGSFVVAGWYSETITLDSGGSAETTTTAVDGTDILLMHFDSSSRLQLVRTAGGTDPDRALGVTRLADDSYVITGYVEGDCVFGAGTATETTLNAQGDRDMYVARYTHGGDLLYARLLGGTGSNAFAGIDSDLGGSLYVSGEFEAEAEFDTGVTRTSRGSEDIVLVRLAPDGGL